MNGTANNYLNGNLGIGITPTVKLHVSGDTILSGSGATSATTALTVQNSSSTNLITVRNDGNVGIGTASPDKRLHILGDATSADIVFQTSGYATKGYFSHYLGQTLQLAVNRRIDGVFSNPSRATSSINLYTANGSSLIQFYSTNTNNTDPLERFSIKGSGQIRCLPLASAPSGAEAGDVYYNSTDNKHYGYNGTTWNAFY
jgi:hypothetical protein